MEPKGRTWARRGARPVVRVRGAGGGRVSIAGVACYRPGDRPHLFYQLLVYRRRKDEAKGFTWVDYRDLMIATHHHLSAPVVWCWDNLNIHLAPQGITSRLRVVAEDFPGQVAMTASSDPNERGEAIAAANGLVLVDGHYTGPGCIDGLGLGRPGCSSHSCTHVTGAIIGLIRTTSTGR